MIYSHKKAQNAQEAGKMKNKMFMITLLLMATAAFAADVVITLTVPDVKDYPARVLEMMRQWDHCHISIDVRGSENAADPNMPDYHAHIDITDAITPEDPNIDNSRQFAKRFMRFFWIECLRGHEMVAAQSERQAAIDDVPRADVNVPDSIIE